MGPPAKSPFLLNGLKRADYTYRGLRRWYKRKNIFKALKEMTL